MKNKYDDSFEKHELELPKWLWIYCFVVNGSMCMYAFVKVGGVVPLFDYLVSRAEFSFDYLFNAFFQIIACGEMLFGFFIVFILSVMGNNFVDYMNCGKKKVYTMLSSILTVPVAFIVVIVCIELLSFLVSCSFIGFLDPRFL